MWQRLRAFFQVLLGTSAGNVAFLPLYGPIFAGRKLRHGLNLENTERLILRAFSLPKLKAVALSINSPGGSPVQSALIMQRVRDLAQKRDVPVLAFAEDIAASGGYMLALAADEIVAHPASLVGSIGVIYAGFGFPGAMKKAGVERRLHTAGKNKAFMDPFSPERKDDVVRLKKLQESLYRYFTALVEDRRGKRLKGPKSKVFSGEVWTAEEAKALGLIDTVGDPRHVLKERFGEKIRIVRISPPKSLFGSWFGLGEKAGAEAPAIGGELADDLLAAVEARLMWNRYGL
jgi:signal peptide peptidase SppA